MVSIRGHSSIDEFLELPKIAERIDKFHAKSIHAIPSLNT